MLRLMMPILAVVLLLVALPFNAAANQRQTPGDAASVQGALTAPQPRTPPDGSHLSNIGPITLQWDAPAGTTQYQLQVIPFNGDGPGINLIRNADSQYTIPAPPTWFVILPGMTYSWQVRVTDKTSFAGEGDPSWSPWSPSWRFATPLPNSDTIRPTQPQLGTTATSQNPTLVWTDVNPAIFYYQIQLSSDPLFNTDPFTATAAVYWNLVHGGETAPQNSWAVPSSARLDTSTRYYWRVRPRVQGDGAPINWGQAFWFMTQGDVNTGKPTNPDLTVTDLQVSESTVAAGGLVRVLYTVKNQGVGTSSPVETHAVLSPDCAITRVKQDLGLIDSVGPLMGGQSATSQTLTVTVPMNQPVGAYCLGVYVDWLNVNKESERGVAGNNGLGKPLVVLLPPASAATATATTTTPTPTATNTPFPTPTLTPSPTPTSTPSPTPTFTPTPTTAQRVWRQRSPLLTARSAAACAEVGGKVYVLGGTTDSVEAYDPQSNTWTAKARMPGVHTWHTAARGANGKLYTFGGSANSQPSTTVQQYDPASDAWTTTGLAPMPVAVRDAAAVTANDGRIYVVGGWNGSQGVGTVQAYDPSANTWVTSLAPMPTGRWGHTAAAGPDGKIYVAGGATVFNGTEVSALEVYNPASNIWEMRAAIPTKRLYTASAFGSDGRYYVIAGWLYGTATYYDVVESFSPATGAWRTEPATGVAKSWACSAAISGGARILSIGGDNPGGGPLNVVQEFSVN